MTNDEWLVLFKNFETYSGNVRWTFSQEWGLLGMENWKGFSGDFLREIVVTRERGKLSEIYFYCYPCLCILKKYYIMSNMYFCCWFF